MSFSTDRLFDLLPAYLRLRDAEEGRAIKGRVAPGTTDPRSIEDFGPLRTLASLVAREGQIVDESLDRLYDDAFIETCAPWAIPYIAELLGVRGLADLPEGLDMRARVANALELRARKGTLRALEQAAADFSGWPVFAVEYWQRTSHVQAMRLPHPEMGRTVDVRVRPRLARIATPFERDARNVEVRRIATAGGRWNLGNIGLHVWRMRPYSIREHRVEPVAAGRRHFRFNPFGCDAALFAPQGVDGGVSEPAQEADMPNPISRAIFAEDVGRFYGPGGAIFVTVDGAPVAAGDVKAAHLGDLPGGGTEPDWNHGTRAGPATGRVLIDPELGRLVVDPALTGPVRVTCHFARPLEIGGGEHDRALSAGSLEEANVLAPSANVVTAVTGAGEEGTFTFEQTTLYRGGGTVNVPADGVLRLVATDRHMPTWRLPATGLTIRLGRRARVEFNGVRIFGGPLRIEGPGAGAVFTDCTLLPGLALTRLGAMRNPGAVSLTMAATGAELRLTRTITGPIRLATDVDARLIDCVVDAGSMDSAAIEPALNARRTVLYLLRCTINGQVRIGRFAGRGTTLPEDFGLAVDTDPDLVTSDTLFTGLVEAEQRQTGCIRFSHVPPGSNTPRLYRCTRTPPPVFTSLRPAEPDYLTLVRGAQEALTRGAENGDQIGIWNRAAHAARGDNIIRSIDDFLRFGHEAGVFHET
ncbi:MAG: phage tail protein [Rhodobacteraceae bacterium]|nr:phage tail protein [Paracoccaceae bacterium]